MSDLDTDPGGLYKPRGASRAQQPAPQTLARAPRPSRRRRRRPPPDPAAEVRRALFSVPKKNWRSSFFFFSDLIRDFSDRDSWSDFRFSLTFRSFIGIGQFKRLEFHLETLYPFNQLKQDFATVKFALDPDY